MKLWRSYLIILSLRIYFRVGKYTLFFMLLQYMHPESGNFCTGKPGVPRVSAYFYLRKGQSTYLSCLRSRRMLKKAKFQAQLAALGLPDFLLESESRSGKLRFTFSNGSMGSGSFLSDVRLGVSAFSTCSFGT